MGVEAHLNIRVDEYDARIRTFIPGYEPMVETVARCLLAMTPRCERVVELGIGTAAVAARCLEIIPTLELVGIEQDMAMVEIARHRLSGAATTSLRHGSFLDTPMPTSDAVVACLALHHVRDLSQKQHLYGDIYTSLRPGGLFVTADCFPSSDAQLAVLEREAWHAHLRQAYSDADTHAFFEAWSHEDTYVPLDVELGMMRTAGFAPEVVWRLAPMGVIAARAAA
jgi:tRNA (cmo5U34)-methyltransferase